MGSSRWRRINGLPPLRSLRGSATAIGAIERLTVELKRLNNEEKTGT
ncbi:MAG: hypothetical protein ACREQ5_00825 [Candidatus Dormibacteria bacterium]